MNDAGIGQAMRPGFRPQLSGEETMLGSWSVLAADSPGAHLLYTQASLAAVFPAWDPLNNAILIDPPSTEVATAAAAELDRIYANAGVSSWALWVPSRRRDLDEPDTVAVVHGMTRDTTTLVMTLELSDGMPAHPGVVATTVAVANDAGDVPIARDALPEPDPRSAVNGWALVENGTAVAGAWTYRAGRDVGVYAVGTAPRWRQRGLARMLMQHVLADAYHQGARTASLQSTRMGEPLYRSLGFQPAGRYEEWVPAQNKQAEPVECRGRDAA